MICLVNSNVLKYTEMIKLGVVIEWILPGCQTPTGIFYVYIHKLYMDQIIYCPSWASFESEKEWEQTKITMSKLRIVIQNM